MQPEFFKTTTFAPGSVDRAKLHEEATAHGEERFKEEGECHPTWLLTNGTHITFVRTTWENEEDKRRVVFVMTTMLKVRAFTGYAFMSEAYRVAGEAAEIDEARKIGLENLEEGLRDEILFVTSADREGGSGWSEYLITKRARPNLPFLGPRIDTEDMLNMSGDFIGIFERGDRLDIPFLTEIEKVSFEE